MKLPTLLMTLGLLLLGQSTFALGIKNKQNVAQSVFDDLVNTYSDNRIPPKLELLSYSSAPATLVADYTNTSSPVIRMSERAYDICAGMGKDSLNALAIILSHELAHYYKEHKYPGGYAFSNDKSTSNKTQLLQIEMEADETGAYYAYLAGFNTIDIQEKLINKIYASYGFPDKVKGYPSKSERQKAGLEKQKNLQNLIPVFETGEVLFTLNYYAEAADCFIYLINKFPSKEMYYNAGVAKLMQAIDLFDNEELPFAYPIEFEAKSRLTGDAVRAIDEQDELQKRKKRQALLKEAEQYLEKAYNLNPNYAIASISLACVYDIQGKHALSIEKIDELLTKGKTGVANGYVIRGIAKVRSGQIEQAKKDLQTAVAQNGLFAQPNLSLLKHYDQSWTNWLTKSIQSYWTDWFVEQQTSDTSAPKLCNPGNESIMNVNPAQFTNRSVSQITINNWQLKLMENNGRWISTPQFDLKFISTPPNYSGTTGLNIKNGNSAHAVSLVYGKPTYSKTTTLGTNEVYRDCRIIFSEDKKGKLQKWTLYKRE
jgi:tetratricopeptide (TPR) repeat protein